MFSLFRRADLSKAFSIDASLVRLRYQADHGVSDEDALLHEREWRRWMTLVAASKTMLGLQAPIVDAFWHEALTHTRWYREYCLKMAGRFIDHDPTGGNDLAYARTYVAYQSAFGETPPEAVWPKPRVALPAPPQTTTSASGDGVYVMQSSGYHDGDGGGDSGGDSGGGDGGGGCGGCGGS